MKRLIGLREVPSLLLFGVMLFHLVDMLGDPGLGWHIKSGELMRESGEVLRWDPFLAGENGARHQWVHTQWLSDLVFSAVFDAGGGRALSLMCLGVGVVLSALILPREEARFGVAQFLMLSLATSLIAIQLITRPVVFSFLLFGLVARVLWDADRDRTLSIRQLGVIALIFLLWTQLHPGFLIGFLLLGAFALSECIRGFIPSLHVAARIPLAKLILLCGLPLGATLLNPYGVELHFAIRSLLASDFFMNLNAEWLSPDFHLAIFAPFLVSIALVLTLSIFSSRVLSVFEVTSLLFFLILALYSRRYIPFYGIIFYRPASVLLLDVARGRTVFPRVLRWSFPASSGILAPAAFFVCFIYALLVAEPAPTFPTPTCPLRALRHISARLDASAPSTNAAKPTVFVHPDWGGCATFELWPRAHAFIDDRNEVNGEARYKEFLQIYRGEPRWKELLLRNQFQYVLLRKSSALAQLLGLESEQSSLHPVAVTFWKKIFDDSEEGTVVYESSAFTSE